MQPEMSIHGPLVYWYCGVAAFEFLPRHAFPPAAPVVRAVANGVRRRATHCGRVSYGLGCCKNDTAVLK